MPPAGTHPDLKIIPLVTDRLVVMARQGHPLLGRRRETRALLDYAWVMPPTGTRARQRLDALFTARNLPPPDVHVETNSMAFLLHVLRRSDLLTFAFRTTLDATDGKGLVVLNVPALMADREAGIILRPVTGLSPAAQSLITTLSAICTRDPRN